jgi:hypothetical protein
VWREIERETKSQTREAKTWADALPLTLLSAARGSCDPQQVHILEFCPFLSRKAIPIWEGGLTSQTTCHM